MSKAIVPNLFVSLAAHNNSSTSPWIQWLRLMLALAESLQDSAAVLGAHKHCSYGKLRVAL